MNKRIKRYLNKIKPNLEDIINDYKTKGELKMQLTMKINFISSKDSTETRTMHSQNRWNHWRMFWFFFTKTSKRFRRISERMWICFW